MIIVVLILVGFKEKHYTLVEQKNECIIVDYYYHPKNTLTDNPTPKKNL